MSVNIAKWIQQLVLNLLGAKGRRAGWRRALRARSLTIYSTFIFCQTGWQWCYSVLSVKILHTKSNFLKSSKFEITGITAKIIKWTQACLIKSNPADESSSALGAPTSAVHTHLPAPLHLVCVVCVTQQLKTEVRFWTVFPWRRFS